MGAACLSGAKTARIARRVSRASRERRVRSLKNASDEMKVIAPEVARIGIAVGAPGVAEAT